MNHVLAACVLGVVLAAVPVGAQPGIEITTPPPSREPAAARTDAGTVATIDPGHSVPGLYVPYAPVFIGPTGKTRTGEYGLSLWLAPETPLPAPETRGNEVGGWAAIGATFTWGGPPFRPPEVPAH